MQCRTEVEQPNIKRKESHDSETLEVHRETYPIKGGHSLKTSKHLNSKSKIAKVIYTGIIHYSLEG